MIRYFDIVENTICVIFVDQLAGVSIFRRTYNDRKQLDIDYYSLQEDDLIECFDCLKKHSEWCVVLLENTYTLGVSLTQGYVF